MAVLTLAKDRITGGELLYKGKGDLRNLVFYCMKKSSNTQLYFLWPLSWDCMIDQMIYYQNWKNEPLRTRALHYILSFDSQGAECFLKNRDLTLFMNLLNDEIFSGHQHMMFLHQDKKSHCHIHIIVNPVNVKTLNLCREGLIQLGNKIAWFLAEFHVALQGFTVRNRYGKIVRAKGDEMNLYQDLYERYYIIS